MSHKASVRRSIKEHMASVGEEIIWRVLDKQQQGGGGGGVCCRSMKLDVRESVLERLNAAAEWMCSLFQRDTETLETLLEARQKQLLDAMLLKPHVRVRRTEVSPEQQEDEEEPPPPQIKDEQQEEAVTFLPRETRRDTLSDFLHQPVCKEEVRPEEEGSPSMEERLQINEVQEELLQRPNADGSTPSLLAVKTNNDENKEMVPLAGTSAEHMETLADVEDCGTSQPSSDEQLLSSDCSESDAEDSEWKETRNVPSDALNTIKSHAMHHVRGQEKASEQTEEKGFSCTECGKTFNRKGNLKMHTMVHTGEKPFTCRVCGKGFCKKCNLKTPTMTPTGERPFICKVCGKCFVHSSKLKTHMHIHTEEKPFICTVCGKGFKEMGHLKIHMRTHTGEKPYTCTVCGKGCGQSGSLTLHMKTHTGEKPYTCKVCGISCCHDGQLKTHMRTHTGEKPFTCTVCGESYSQKSNLKTHMRTHTGEKPFTCTVCGKGYTQKGGLTKHMRTHAGGKTP